jgi:hypothetical protein
MMLGVHPDYRQKLLKLRAKYDQLIAKADAILAEPVIEPEDDARAAKVRDILAAMRAKVKAKLDRVTES